MPQIETNGIDTFYEDTGDGPLVVLIHGHSLDLRMWKYQVGPLVDMGYRVLRYDVRGHGRSMVPPTGYTWDNYSNDLFELLERIDGESAHVVGLSMGGGIALKLTLDHPERVLSLTLVDSTLAGFSYSAQFGAGLQELRTAIGRDGVRAAFDTVWLAHPVFDGVRRQAERFAEVAEMVAGFQAAEYLQVAATGYVQPDLASRLGEVTVPTLVVVGEEDFPDFRLIADLLASNITRAKQIVLPGCGHIPPMEDPDAFNRILLKFLASNSQR
jgi:pimeloyl-ACP methyl ester carboxylesterase